MLGRPLSLQWGLKTEGLFSNRSSDRKVGERERVERADQACSLKAPWAALEAALAAAACTVLLDMTPEANSCWALSKLAPVVRYKAWI